MSIPSGTLYDTVFNKWAQFKRAVLGDKVEKIPVEKSMI